jgi:hypothetical protein
VNPNPTDEDIVLLLAACGLKMPPLCGTVPAYMRHLSVGETPCEPCRTTFDAARAGWVSKPRRTRPIRHGTPAGARAHQKRREPACGPCARAYRAYQRDFRARKRLAA